MMCEKYNDDVWELNQPKKEYLRHMIDSGIEENTVTNLYNLLKRIYEFEKTYLHKDIKDCGTEGIRKYFTVLNVSSADTLRVYTGYLEGYIQFCKNNGYCRDVVDTIRFLKEDAVKEYVDVQKYKFKYITDEERLNKMVDDLEYFTDKVTLQLIWEGCLGKEYSDLRLLKMSDINFENKTMSLHSGLVLSMSDKLIEFVKATRDEHSVYNFTLVASDYVVKAYNQRADTEELMSPVKMMNRLRRLKLQQGWEYVTPDTIFKSGVIHKCLKHFRVRNGKQYLENPILKPRFAEYFAEHCGCKMVSGYKIVRIAEEVFLGIEPTSATSIRGRGRVKG